MTRHARKIYEGLRKYSENLFCAGLLISGSCFLYTFYVNLELGLSEGKIKYLKDDVKSLRRDLNSTRSKLSDVDSRILAVELKNTYRRE